jgi:hypothetical protein
MRKVALASSRHQLATSPPAVWESKPAALPQAFRLRYSINSPRRRTGCVLPVSGKNLASANAIRSSPSIPKQNEYGEGEEGHERRYPQRAVEKQHGEDDDPPEDHTGEEQVPRPTDQVDVGFYFEGPDPPAKAGCFVWGV